MTTGFSLLQQLEELKISYKFMSEKEMSYNDGITKAIDIVADWLKQNNLLDEVDY